MPALFLRYCVQASTGDSTYVKTVADAQKWADVIVGCRWFKVYLARGRYKLVAWQERENGAWVRRHSATPEYMDNPPTAKQRRQRRDDARRPSPDWLTVKEWCKMHGLNYSTVQSWCFLGNLDYQFFEGKRFIHRAAVPAAASQVHRSTMSIRLPAGQRLTTLKRRLETWKTRRSAPKKCSPDNN